MTMLDHTTFDWNATFDDLLDRFRQASSIGNDEIVGATRGLIDEVLDAHEEGRVADLARVELLGVSPEGELALGRVPIGAPVERSDIGLLDAGGDDTAPLPPAEGYASWERALGHHDALGDIFTLGMLMGCLATRLDFRDPGQLDRFLRHRANLARLNPRLHPVLARVIADMTEPRRSARAADLSALIDLIDDYRSVEVDDAAPKADDLAEVADPAQRRERTQEYFRNRLFEVTRRNKLLYFADRHGVDLTRGSLPLMLDYKALNPRQLLTASPDLLQRLGGLHEQGEAKGELDLRRWLQCADYPYLAPALDKVRSAARKDSRELGFNQLRLVLAFLRWHDATDGERVNTPLVMLPVSLKKQAGSGDGFSLVMEAAAAEADVNPVLRYVLADRFRIDLPETIDMTSLDAVRDLARRMQREIGQTRPGLSIRLGETPRLQSLQAAIRRQIDEHRRRQRRTTSQLKDWHGVGYSYAADNYQPLGFELFDRFVRTHVAHPLDAATPEIASGMPSLPEVYVDGFDAFAGEASAQTDPLAWEIDLCAVTLANFNTRKMSLVRDYETLLEGYTGQHGNYRRLFDASVRPDLQPLAKVAHWDRNLVLPSDPSQDDAILRAATGESYVIQGPPGTGKSQTIANLLADLAASGKSVLFVCEKRVALDVVHGRLRDAGIGDLASLVHDAREDRLRFIADLKGLYETWQASRTNRTLRDKRAALVAEIERLAGELETFSAAMQRSVGAGETTLRDLMGLAIADGIPRVRLPLREREAAPPWGAFVEGERFVARFEALLDGIAVEPAAVISLVSVLRKDLVGVPDLATELDAILPALETAAADATGLATAAVPVSDGHEVTLGDLMEQTALAGSLEGPAQSGRLALLNRDGPEARRLRGDLEKLTVLAAAAAEANAVNGDWHAEPDATQTEAWLRLARRNEDRLWSFLSRDWREAQEAIRQKLGHEPDSFTRRLTLLGQAHRARAAYTAQARLIRDASGFSDPDAASRALEALWRDEATASPAARGLMAAVLADAPAATHRLRVLAEGRGRLEVARDVIASAFARADRLPVGSLPSHVATLAATRDRLGDLLRCMAGLEQEAPTLAQAWKRLPMSTGLLRAASMHKEIQVSLAQAPPGFERTTGSDLQRMGEQLQVKLAELRGLNARAILDERKSRFRQKIASPDRAYDAGRAFLEHQFSLFRPSAALRDCLTGAPGVVVRELKPIWMMSPLSVADTLPLDEALFDVVVFDEASQIPIEDALPTLYRAPQMIVVGDEMQLPPPSYFGRKLDADEADLPDYIAFGMQAESLLDKAAGTLPATPLEWHYRSRHESLIGFCNQAFYAGRLRTIPSRFPLSASQEIDTTSPASLKDLAQRVLARPISFHRLHDGAYIAQQNHAEAGYIADLVRALLSQDASKSIGIVAFSQSQQGAIETAIERLANEHAPFRARLERAMGLEHEELFIKNLENVQGDERDIIIVSVAYGPGATGRMAMNFGPINQEGGEKRLNVIFSRAKHHVAVVASFEPQQITNDWNKGARALKRYLMYAAATSTGDEAAMHRAVEGYPGAAHVERMAALDDPLADLVAAAYRQQGRAVVRGLGQSTARCDVAVRTAGGAPFSTAVLTDNPSHYAIADVIDRYVTYPGLLRASGWIVNFALAKDWVGRIPRGNEAADAARQRDQGNAKSRAP